MPAAWLAVMGVLLIGGALVGVAAQLRPLLPPSVSRGRAWLVVAVGFGSPLLVRWVYVLLWAPGLVVENSVLLALALLLAGVVVGLLRTPWVWSADAPAVRPINARTAGWALGLAIALLLLQLTR